jgi:hypothetical protein
LLFERDIVYIARHHNLQNDLAVGIEEQNTVIRGSYADRTKSFAMVNALRDLGVLAGQCLTHLETFELGML